MKKALFIILLLAPAFAWSQNRADQQSLDDPGSSTLILLGDTQAYLKYDVNQAILDLTMAWIADNQQNLNIKAVLCTGDVVDRNDSNYIDKKKQNQNSTQMWKYLSHCLERLDNRLPFISTLGNHDYGYRCSENYNTNYPDYVNVERSNAYRSCLVAEYHNRAGRMSLENAAFRFALPGWDRHILVISTEFFPSEGAVEWARKTINSNKYANDIVIYLTHSYLVERTAEYTPHEDRFFISSEAEGHYSGKDLWEKFISKEDNIRLVLCGHTGKPTGDLEDSIAWRVDKNESGKNVYQMMFNNQMLGGGWQGNGGDGWLRILEFKPDGKTVGVKTYSPLFGISPETKHLAHRTAPYDQFEFTIE